jgi:tetratricopeptide (TPR) repeat protein
LKPEVKQDFFEAVRLHESGDFLSAKNILLRLAGTDPTSPAIFCTLGLVCRDMKHLREGVEAFKRAIELAPKLEAVSLGLFHCLWELGEKDEAFEEMKRFMAISDSADYRDIIKSINDD